MAPAKKNFNSTIITLAFVGIAVYFAYKYISKKHFGGGGGGGGGPVGGVAGSLPYYPNQPQQRQPLSANVSFGGGSGGPSSKGQLPSPYGPTGPQSIADALSSGLYDASSENALATIYNAQQGFSTANDAPIDFGELGGVNSNDFESSAPTTISEQPEDTSGIFDSFNSWWNSFTGTDLNTNTGPEGSDISADDLSQYSSFVDSGGDYSGAGDIGDYGGAGGGFDPGSYDGGDGYNDGSYDSGDESYVDSVSAY